MFRIFTLGAALVASLVALGQPPGNHALVPDLGNSRTASPDDDACDVKNQLTREIVFTESEKFASKLLLGTFALNNKYEEVRQSPAMQTVATPMNDTGQFIKKLLEAHKSYVTSSATRDGQPVSGYSSALLPPAALGLAGFSVLIDTKTDKTYLVKNRWARFGLKSNVSSAIASSVAIFKVGSSANHVLPFTAADLTLAEQAQIRDALESGVDAPVKFVGDVLGWNAAQRAQFSRALNRKVVDTMTRTVTGADVVHDIKSGERPLDIRLIANLQAINFFDLIKQENLASEDQLSALKQMQELQDIVRKLQSTEVTAAQVTKQLETNGKMVKERIQAMLRLHRLLLQTEKELPDGAAKNEVKKLIAETTAAIETIRLMCELGR